MIPDIYSVSDSFVIFNELDNRGHVSFYRSGRFEDIPEEIDVLQIFESSGHSSTFFSKKLHYKRLGGILNNQKKVIERRIDDLKEIDKGIKGEAVDYRELCRIYGFGQLYSNKTELSKNLKFSIDAIKLGDIYISSLVSDGNVEKIPENCISITLKFKDAPERIIYVCGGEDRHSINDQLSKIKRELFLKGHTYFDPKRHRMVNILSAAFPGNGIAWENVSGAR